MQFKFRGAPLTRVRLGWWLRIVLTRLFGSKVSIEGRTTPLRILPWVWKGRLLLMGAQHDFLQAYFVNQYTLRLRSSPPQICAAISSDFNGNHRTHVAHIVLGHQDSNTINEIVKRNEKLGPRYSHLLAYGGDEKEYNRISITNKIYISCPTLRGHSNRMSHIELIESAFRFYSEDRLLPRPEYLVFTESDLLPLSMNYLDSSIACMNLHSGDFGGKSIRDVTLGNCSFLTDAVNRGIAGPTAGSESLQTRRYFHCIGCFFIIRTSFIERMLQASLDMRGLYFEVLFPTAAHAAGGRIVSLDLAIDALEHIRYRPFFSYDQVVRISNSKYPMVHPVKGEDLLKSLQISSAEEIG